MQALEKHRPSRLYQPEKSLQTTWPPQNRPAADRDGVACLLFSNISRPRDAAMLSAHPRHSPDVVWMHGTARLGNCQHPSTTRAACTPVQVRRCLPARRSRMTSTYVGRWISKQRGHYLILQPCARHRLIRFFSPEAAQLSVEIGLRLGPEAHGITLHIHMVLSSWLMGRDPWSFAAASSWGSVGIHNHHSGFPR